jgi:hypothetical protein
MAVVPFRLHFEQSRRDRLAVQLESWAPCLAACLGFTSGMTFLSLVVSPWFALLLPLPVVVSRRFLAHLGGIIRRPTEPVEVEVTEGGLSVTAGGEHAWLPLEGVIQVGKSGDVAWTVYHYGGRVVHIPAAAITPEQLDYLKAAARRFVAARKAVASTHGGDA